jgi:hypothetical protein
MTTAEIGRKYVALSREGKRAEILDSLFAKDVVSVEAVAPPGGERRTVDEIGLFTVAGGKITREEFFYPVG